MSTFLCPRRVEGPFHYPDEDHWRDNRTCSFCGSMMPEDVFTEIEKGTEVTPTDKSYKIYVGGSREFYFQHFSKDDKQHFIELVNKGAIKLAYPGHFYVTPFFCKRVQA